MDLLASPALRIERTSAHLGFVVTDPQGMILARAEQVGGQRKNTFARWLGSAPSNTTPRMVVQVSAADGTPLLFVDRPDHQRAAGTLGRHLPPVAVVAPDGSLVGWVGDSKEGLSGKLGHGASFLADAHGQHLCNAVMTDSGRQNVYGTQYGSGKCSWVFQDAQGIQLADLHWSGKTNGSGTFDLRTHYQLPDPLRTLIAAFPFAFAVRTTS